MDELQQLREALSASPDNLPIRLLLAEKLLIAHKHPEAEAIFKQGLKRNPDHPELKIGLARAFYLQEKISAGLVLLEDLTTQPAAPAQAFLWLARLLLKNKQLDEAGKAYATALVIDESIHDEELAELAERSGSQEENLEDEREPQRMRVGPDFDPDEDFDLELERPEIDFEHVGGMDEVKQEIRMKIIHPLEHPELYEAYGKKVGGGMLLYGPPGCGKTYLARATAGQVNANFLTVGINEILDMWIGNSERNLHALFEKARRSTPCVLFFDEVDALGANRADLKHSGNRNLINQFLAELDGVEFNNDGVLILAATNAPWHLDPAFRRPGRFDRILFVPPPDEPAREAIMEIILKEKPTEQIDHRKLARKTKGFSGADLTAVVDRAVEAKLEEAMRSGVPVPMNQSDLEKAVGKVVPSTREWFSSAKNYAVFANEGGQYDDVLAYIKKNK